MKYTWSYSVEFMDGSAASSNGLTWEQCKEETDDFISDKVEDTHPRLMAKKIIITGELVE